MLVRIGVDLESMQEILGTSQQYTLNGLGPCRHTFTHSKGQFSIVNPLIDTLYAYLIVLPN